MLRAGEVAAALGVTRQTAHRYLRQLVAEGHLVAEGAGRGARYLTEVFAEYTRDFEFTRTRTVVRLFAIGTEFVSRSQARRLVNGLERFREVVLDFGGVELVGQGFVDEVFRVWARQRPETALIPIAMGAPVAFMVERAIRGASALGRGDGG